MTIPAANPPAKIMRFSRLIIVLLFASTASADELHWSLRPVTRPAIPFVQSIDVRNSIDAFIAARLVKERSAILPEAGPEVLIRRVTYDLTGLPPSVDEIDRFVSDHAARPQAAYEALVDRLLASPRYGETWGRHWLDVVRYAESEGFEYDRHRPGAWRFRDYVIASFNADKPFDRFITEQLAGDEIDPNDRELLIAAGFHRLGPVRRNAGNQKLAFSRHEVLAEMTDIIGPAFLGLTVGCARCHDHKFDDIPAEDYYALQAFVAAVQEHDIVLADDKTQAGWKRRAEPIQKEMERIRKKLPELNGEEEKRALDRLAELDRAMPEPLPAISTVRNVAAERTPIHVLKRGDTERKGKLVGPRFLSLVPGGDEAAFPAEMAKPRVALAKWITSRDNPLTARVFVNRVWQHHFGRALVDTPNDFGINGSTPTHPELLDWLAAEFMDSGWRLKALHRLIVASATYRQASQMRNAELGMRNYDGFARRRLSAEEVRDSMLLVAGRLNEKLGGPSVMVPVDADLVKLLYAPAQWAVTSDVKEHDRRSVYLVSKRNLRLPFLEAFDQPDAQTSCAGRVESTHALQALEMLNGKLSNALAASFAERLRREAGDDPSRQIDLAYRLVAGRLPTVREKEVGLRFLKSQPLSEFALAMLNLNAFLYVE